MTRSDLLDIIGSRINAATVKYPQPEVAQALNELRECIVSVWASAPSTSCCADWAPGIKAVNDPITLQTARSGVQAYNFKPFRFCPWCGQNRGEGYLSTDEAQQEGWKHITDGVEALFTKEEWAQAENNVRASGNYGWRQFVGEALRLKVEHSVYKALQDLDSK